MVGKFMNTIATSCKRQEMLRVAQVEGLEQALELGEIETGLIAERACRMSSTKRRGGRDQDIVNAVELIYSTKSELETLRTDDGLEEFLKNVTFFCMKHKIEVVNMDDGYMLVVRSKKFFPNVKNHHRFKVEMFLSIINRQLQELNDRFDEVNTELLICMSAFSPSNSFACFDKGLLHNKGLFVRLAEFYPFFCDYGLLWDRLMFLPSQLEYFIGFVRRDEWFKKWRRLLSYI
ncbi:hypothetical protein EJB05_52498, partial [Eragrostis curvula]